MKKIVAKPVGLAASTLAGLVAGAIFKQVWKLKAGDKKAPAPTDFDHDWGEVLLASALEGAIFGAVRAGVQRMAASHDGEEGADARRH